MSRDKMAKEIPSMVIDSFDVRYEPKYREFVLEWENAYCIQRVRMSMTEATILMAEVAKTHQAIEQETI